MAHWSQDFDAFKELETLYEEKRKQWATMKHGADGPTGEQNFTTSAEERAAAYEFRRNELNLLADEFARARDHWRNIGVAAGERDGIKIQHNTDDDGNPIGGDQ